MSAALRIGAPPWHTPPACSPAKGRPTMRSFVAELKRRNVFRVAIAYGAISWLLLQACGLIFEAFDLPHTATRVLLVVLVLGFLPTLLFAWAYELTPDGLQRESGIESGDSVRRLTGRKFDFIIIGVLTTLVGLLLLDRLVLSPRSEGSSAKIAAKPPVLKTSATASIAVLPFLDLSNTRDQEYFSDGMSEELLNLLTQVPGLHVAGRTSSFSFKDKHATIAEIGKALNVTTVLEGSVRKSGERLRVTAQLINVADDYHLWSQTYDRKLTDVFAVQDDIAGAVVDALKLKLLPAQRPSTAKHHVPGFETYDHYLLGIQLLARNDPAGITRAVASLRQAVAQDPDYAAAYAGLAMAESFAVEDSPDPTIIAQGHQRAMAAAERAVTLDPTLGDAYGARGYVRTSQWDWNGALADLVKAVALDPGEARNQLRYGYLLAALGRLPEANAALEKGTEQNPLFTPIWYTLAKVKAAQADYDGARRAAERVLAIDPDYRSASSYLGIIALLKGDPAAARAVFAKYGNPLVIALAEHDLGHPAQSQHALDQWIGQHARDDAYHIAAAFAWRGDRDRAFEWLQRAIAQHDSGIPIIKYDPLLRSLRDDPRYAALLAQLGLPP
ncbi:MAG: tetratricopeptide repeat protein [Rhodanobacteraceae bacterium]